MSSSNNNNNNNNSNINSNMVELVIPTPEDFHSLAVMKDLAFVEKRGCLSNSAKNISENVKMYQTYAEKYPSKIQHCRIVKDNTTDGGGTVIGACQLQLQGDVGDLSFPEFVRHQLVQGEVYVEWIACHPNHTGKGVGSKLLRWAEQFAKEQQQQQGRNNAMLTLEVMKKNEGAMRLYERKGFVWKKGSDDPHYESGDCFFGGLFVYCCLGCQYWTVCYMEKDLR